MDTKNLSKTGMKLIVQTLAIILFLIVCTFFIMKLIDKESDSLSIFFIGFGSVFIAIVLLAVYIKYVVNIYSQIRNAKKQHNLIEISIEQNEKRHMKVVHSTNNKKHKRKGNKKKR